jgi:hypothetical protein
MEKVSADPHYMSVDGDTLSSCAVVTLVTHAEWANTIMHG